MIPVTRKSVSLVVWALYFAACAAPVVNPTSPTGKKNAGGENFLQFFRRDVFVSRLASV